MSLPQQAKDLLDAANIVTVATINPDGSPQTSLLWATYEGDEVLLSTIEGRAKHRNFLLDPRVSVLIHDKTTVGTYVELRGSVTLATEGGDELIQRLSQHYDGEVFTGDEGKNRVRVVGRLAPEHVVSY